MRNEALEPLLRQLAEKRLGRALQPEEEQVLVERLRRETGNPQAQAAAPVAPAPQHAPAPSPPALAPRNRQEVRDQMKHFLQLNQQKAYEKMRGILQTIDAQNETTLKMLDAEQKTVSGMLDAREPPNEPGAPDSQPAPPDPQEGTRQALLMIGAHMTELVKQEIEKCFQWYVEPLAEQVKEMHERVRDLQARAQARETDEIAPASPATAEAAPNPSNAVHDAPGPASLE
ncbi:hypothetical protein [Burkholderia alba]|uniref:hypothetical protein n=1 Tax=Burkholderia alba TaxID=2683677 RepID=UPI002B054B48|nr:hypothetical protein [Burkholderia alba]